MMASKIMMSLLFSQLINIKYVGLLYCKVLQWLFKKVNSTTIRLVTKKNDQIRVKDSSHWFCQTWQIYLTYTNKLIKQWYFQKAVNAVFFLNCTDLGNTFYFYLFNERAFKHYLMVREKHFPILPTYLVK